MCTKAGRYMVYADVNWIRLSALTQSEAERLEQMMQAHGRLVFAIDNSSGDKLLDEAALNAVKAAKPGKMPAAFTRDALKARFNFLYNP